MSEFKPLGSTYPTLKHKSTVDPFTDKILGDWVFDKKSSNRGDSMWWVRKATITLAEVYAQDYTDPKTLKPAKIYGEITLIQKKSVNKKTSDMNMFRSIEPTAKSVIKEVIL